jgi:hypothetical protein
MPQHHDLDPDRHRDVLAALGLACVYFALASGHYQSIDGMLTFQQARSILYDRSLVFREPFLWGGSIATSKYGIGLSLLYLPGLLAFSWLEPYVHQARPMPMDYGRLYVDPVYAAGGVPLQIGITALSAYLVARFCRALGLSRSHALWGLVLYGLASPALSYARSDFAQPLLGLFWIGGLYAAFLHLKTGRRRELNLAGLAVFGSVLTRPVDGLLLTPAVLLMVIWTAEPKFKDRVQATMPVISGALVGVLVTLIVNYGRYGSLFSSGYVDEGWRTNLFVGLAGLLISPGRGVVWAFPAVLLAGIGTVALARTHRPLAISVSATCVGLLLLMSGWHAWWGGVNWGPRLLVPTLPLLAVLAVAGIAELPQRRQAAMSLFLLLAGFAWALPTAIIDLNAYGGHFNGTRESFALEAHPLIFAVQAPRFLHARTPLDVYAVDIAWWRLTGIAGAWPLLVFGALLAAAAVLFYRSARR